MDQIIEKCQSITDLHNSEIKLILLNLAKQIQAQGTNSDRDLSQSRQRDCRSPGKKINKAKTLEEEDWAKKEKEFESRLSKIEARLDKIESKIDSQITNSKVKFNNFKNSLREQNDNFFMVKIKRIQGRFNTALKQCEERLTKLIRKKNKRSHISKESENGENSEEDCDQKSFQSENCSDKEISCIVKKEEQIDSSEIEELSYQDCQEIMYSKGKQKKLEIVGKKITCLVPLPVFGSKVLKGQFRFSFKILKMKCTALGIARKDYTSKNKLKILKEGSFCFENNGLIHEPKINKSLRKGIEYHIYDTVIIQGSTITGRISANVRNNVCTQIFNGLSNTQHEWVPFFLFMKKEDSLEFTYL